jgi:ElaB/YqjD/DUF883 family membrane-anchored ribosome-binding protein
MEQVDNLVDRAGAIQDAATQTVSRLAETAASRASEMRDHAATRIEELRRVATNEMRQARDNVRKGILEARRKTKYWQREYPVQTIAAIAGAAFVVGIVLRTWRSRDE